ncbi:ATP-dependent RNA helicase DHH1-like [Quercus robur]|uniref:ATP-dependent RNA helicase DHH1-like n=1 Tax=Quercus robur TaxID=38942 RepID=UPI00216354CA|nr:ATP-dependent RNA helicase DHH1-like [Quercus robur]
MASSNQAVGSQPQAPAPQPHAPAPQPQAPWSQNPSQWYSSDFRYTVRGASWFSSSQPTPHTPGETWDSRPQSSQPTRPPATRGAALRGRGDAARPQKCRTRGGKASCGVRGRGRGRGSK